MAKAIALSRSNSKSTAHRSELTVDMEGPELELKNHRIPLEGKHTQGWGRVSIPADENSTDNDFYFVYDEEPPRRTVLVAEDRPARPLELAAANAPDPAIKSNVEVLTTDQLSGVVWEDVALLLWSSPLPRGDATSAIRQFVNRGGQVIFFPPHTPGNGKFLDVGSTNGRRRPNRFGSKLRAAIRTCRRAHKAAPPCPSAS